MLRDVQRIGKRLCRGAGLAHRHQIEGRKLYVGQLLHKPASPSGLQVFSCERKPAEFISVFCAIRAYTRVSIAVTKFPTKKVNDSDELNFEPASILRSLASKNHDGAAFRVRS